MIKGTSKRRITEGEAMPRTFISLRFRQFSENSVVKVLHYVHEEREAQLETSEGTEVCSVFSTDLTIRPL
jgi:hypothetical protein